MMIIHDEDQLKETESTMIADNNSIIKEDQINDLSLTSIRKSSTDEPLKHQEDLLKSSNKRKQIKPNRVSNDNDSFKQQEAFCTLCDRSFCNKYFLKTHFAKKHGVLNVNSPPSPPQPSIIDPKQSEDYCEICQKRFCNKYYLRKHKGECHGIYTDYIKSLQKTNNDSPVKNSSGRTGNSPFYLPSSPTSPEQRTMHRCQFCPEEFRNRALLRVHLATHHPNEKLSTPSLPISPNNKLGFLQPFVDTSSPLAHKLVAGQSAPSPYGILHDSYFCAKMADRVVCEICNKQVCNKYFLKTHKAKVHGIANDQLPPTMVPPVDEPVENSDVPSSTEFNYQTLMELMKAAGGLNGNPLLSLMTNDDESDGTINEQSKRKRSSSQSSTEQNKRLQTSNEKNGGLQPFLIESEDPKFAHTFVPCMVYLPVVRRVTKQVKLNLRLKPVLTPETGVAN